MIKMNLIYHREDHSSRINLVVSLQVCGDDAAKDFSEKELVDRWATAIQAKRWTTWWERKTFFTKRWTTGWKMSFLRLERHLACTVLSRSTLLCRIENRKSSKLTKTSPELRVCSVLSHCTPLVEEILPPPFPDWLLRWQMRMWWWL